MLTKTKPGTELKAGFVLIAFAFALAWAPRLLWGFWTDETGTFWMASHGWATAATRSAEWAGQSILFGVVESFFVWPGPFQEIILRLPSLLGAVVAALYAYRLMEHFVAPGSGVTTIVTLLCLPDVVTFGTNARPYALVIAAACASAYYLLAWSEDPRWKCALQYALSLFVLLNLHYLAALALIGHALFLSIAWRKRRMLKDTPWRWNLPVAGAAAIFAAAGFLLAPLRTSLSQARTFVGGARPEWSQLGQYLTQPAALAGVAVALALGAFLYKGVQLRAVPIPTERIGLLVGWWLPAPILFFLAGYLGDHNPFTSRYMLVTLPAFAMLLGWAVTTIGNEATRRTVVCGVFASAILHPAMLIQSFSKPGESWREPLALVRSMAAPETTVMISSGLVESTHFNWKAESPPNSRFYAALTAYPLTGLQGIRPLPFTVDSRDRDGSLAQLNGQWGNSSNTILICLDGSEIHKWFLDEAKSRRDRVEENSFNRLVVLRATSIRVSAP